MKKENRLSKIICLPKVLGCKYCYILQSVYSFKEFYFGNVFPFV